MSLFACQCIEPSHDDHCATCGGSISRAPDIGERSLDDRELRSLKDGLEKLHDVLRWLRGETVDEDGRAFGDRKPGEGAFWWREKLRPGLALTSPIGLSALSKREARQDEITIHATERFDNFTRERTYSIPRPSIKREETDEEALERMSRGDLR